MFTSETKDQSLLETEADDKYENPSQKTEQTIAEATTMSSTHSRSNMWFVFAISLFTFQSMVAIYRSHNDMKSVSFIVGADVAIAALSWSIRAHEKPLVGSKQRERHRISIWLLATLLNVGFAYRVTMMMPLVVKWVLWAFVGVTTVGTFHLYFLRPDHIA
ncbi:hypothetical protein QJS10_CPB21g01034 [Acorus calamus]|uniref:Uncharacterized protein n=1 Tax=Acorus calamus TaxID=4465 RepID=A0AAV9C5N4_ACOCL|nr:hypothetical protein QJS10_CPB21g01034 [Acorus calamus]